MHEITLTEDQHNASIMFTNFILDEKAKFMVIRGAAGTGKSTLVKYLLDSIQSQLNLYAILPGSKDDVPVLAINLTATTNKAAAVLAELSGKDCSTIHSRLGLTPKENYQTGEIDFIKGRNYECIYNTLLIIDESSFVDDNLFKLIDEATHHCKILFIGDQYQLAPVNQVTTILDKIDGYVVTLDKIMRHSGNIAKAGAKFRETVNTGIFKPIRVDGNDIIHVDGPTFQSMIGQTFLDKDYNASKARVLAWQNATVNMYNNYIRGVMGHSQQFGLNDVLTTNRPIVNPRQGDVIATTETTVEITCLGKEDTQQGIPGRWVQINGYSPWFFLPHDPIQAGLFIKSIRHQKKWPLVFGLQKRWLDLRPAFASTVHKSQGSTYETVFVNLTDIGKCCVASDVARMLYVALTRASKRVVLYGQLPPMYNGAYNHAKECDTGVPA